MPDIKDQTVQTEFALLRKPEEPVRLERATMQWWAELPLEKRPVNLIKAHPRIVNTIASCWHDYTACQKYLQDLIMDPRRLYRQGFPFEIANEISDLHNLLTESNADPTMHKDGIFRS